MSKPVKWTLSETYDMNDRLFQRLQSRLNAAERTFRRCLQDLKRLEAERLSSELPEPAPQPRFDPSRDCKGAVPASPQPEQSKHETPKLASIRRPTPQPQPSASETPAPASQSPDASSAKPLDPRPETSK